MGISKDKGVSHFIYASSSSVYGIKEEENVTEDLPLKPLTDYSKYKALCEEVLLKAQAPGFTSLILRPATVCGYSPRLRLDLAVNILNNSATNLRVLAWLTGGESLHNNHHAYPSSPKFSMSRFEFDPSWVVIRALMLLRLVRLVGEKVNLAA